MMARQRWWLRLVAASTTVALAPGLVAPGGQRPGHDAGRPRPAGASDTAPGQRTGSAGGGSHQAGADATRTPLRSAPRQAVRPPGAVPDAVSLPPVVRPAPPQPVRVRPTVTTGVRTAAAGGHTIRLSAAGTVNGGTDDTYVSTVAGGDRSGALDLQVGSPDGASRTRSFLHFDQLPVSLRNKYITGATLNVDAIDAASCTASPVTLYEVTSPWSGGSLRWPGASVGRALASRSFAHGKPACQPGGAFEGFAIDPDAVTDWTHGDSFFGFSLRAANESDPNGWKRFASANSANVPYLDITYSDEGAAFQAKQVQLPTANTPGRLVVTVDNRGGSSWPAGGPFTFGYTVKKKSDGSVVNRSAHVAPPGTVAPGGSGTWDVALPALTPADYTVELTMFDAQGRDFHTQYGVPYGVFGIRVTNVLPAVNYEQPGSGAEVGTLTPTLYAEGVDPDDWPGTGLKFSFRISSSPAGRPDCSDAGWTGWIGRAWSVPAGRLSWSTTYYWWVRAHDGVGAGPCIGPLALTTTVPQPEITSHLAGAAAQAPSPGEPPGLDPQVGNYATSAVDASVPTAGPPLAISRTYNSLDPRRDAAFGAGWASLLDMRLATDDDGSGNAVVTYPDGTQMRFGRNPDGRYAAPQGRNVALVLNTSTGVATLRDRAGNRWEFDAVGRLVTVIAPTGLVQRLSYDRASNLANEIVDETSRRKLALTWTGTHLGTAQAAGGPTWTYTYDGDKLIQACRPGPAPNCTRYAYAPGSQYRSTVLDDSPRAYWRFGEATGADAASAVARDNTDTGSYTDVTLGAAGGPGGSSDTAASFDGVQSRVALPNRITSTSLSVSLELWFRTTSAGVLFSYQNKPFPAQVPTLWTPVLYVGTDGLLRGGFWVPSPIGERQVRTARPVNDGAWHHAVLAAAIDRQTLYLDGAAVGTVNGVIDHDQQGYLTVGAGRGRNWPATNNGDFYFNGSIDEVALYPHTLGGQAARAHFTAGQSVDQLTRVTLPQDDRVWAAVGYDGATGRVRTLTDHDGRQWTLDAPTQQGSTRVVRLAGPYPDWIYAFDIDHGGRLTSRGHNGTVERFTYNAAGFLAEIVDQNGHPTRFTTDSRGNVLSETTCRATNSCDTSYQGYFLNAADPLDPRNDKPVSTSDARSAGATDPTYQTTYGYDTAGRLVSTGFPIPAGAPARPAQSQEYTAGTEPAVGGGTTPAGLLARQVGRRGQVTTYAYTAAGDLAAVVSPTGLRTSYGYDAIGRTTTVRQANSGDVAFGTTTYSYTARSQVETVTGPAVTNPVTGARHQQVTRYGYDGDGNVTTLTLSDALGGDATRGTAFGYDSHDRLVLTTFPDGGRESRSYDRDMRVLTVTDATGIAWHEEYDDQQRVLGRTVEGPGVDPQNSDATSLVLEFRAYDPAGRLESVKDAMGRTTRYTYYDDDLPATTRLTGFHDRDGTARDIVVEQRSYDPDGNLSQFVAAGGATTTYAYDPAGYLATRVFDPAVLNRAVSFRRDADGNPAAATRTGAASPGRSEATTFTYDPANLVVRQDDQLASGVFLSTRYVRDERGLVTARTDRRSNTTNYSYDPTGALAGSTLPTVDTWSGGQLTAGVRPAVTIGRNAFGDITDQRDPAGAVTRTGRDTMGREATVTLPDYTPPGGSTIRATTTTEYDKASRPVKVTDPLGRVRQTAYDPAGRITAQTVPQVGTAPNTYRFAYDRDGELLESTDPVGDALRYTYDDLGRQVSAAAVERSGGPVAFYTAWTDYDDAGDPTKVTSPENHAATFAYNAAGEKVTETDPTNLVTRHGYDLAGRQVSVTDPAGLVTTTEYDLLGRPRKVSQASGSTVLRAVLSDVDENGNVTGTTSPEGRRAAYVHDAADRLIQQTEVVNSSTSVVTSLGYDAAGRRTRFVDGNQHATDYTYTPWGLSESTVEAGSTWLTSYDAAGQAVSQTAPGGIRRTRTFDAQGRLTTETGTGADATTADRSLGYDAAGRLTRESTPRGDTSYGYDDRGHLVQASGPTGNATFFWSGDGLLTQRVDQAGAATFAYNAAGRIASMTDPVVGRTVDYGYDSAGRVGSVTDRSSPKVKRVVSYDDLGRTRSDAVQETYDSGVPPRVMVGTSYEYDRDGNATAKTVQSGSASARNTYRYDGAGRLSSWTAPDGAVTDYGWDGAGNRVKAGATTYAYNEHNQLVSDGTATYTYTARGTLDAVTGPTGTRDVAFDAFDRLVSDGSATYAYDSLDRVTQRGAAQFGYADTSNAVVTDGSRVVSRTQDGSPFADKATGGGTGQMLYTDEHGDAVARYLSADVGGSRTFDPFGKVVASSAEQSTLGYQGSWTDPDSGSVNMAARWYSPSTGTFLSRDSWTLPPTPSANANRYAYGNGDPVGNTDPSGHCLPECAIPSPPLILLGIGIYLSTPQGQAQLRQAMAAGGRAGAAFAHWVGSWHVPWSHEATWVNTGALSIPFDASYDPYYQQEWDFTHRSCGAACRGTDVSRPGSTAPGRTGGGPGGGGSVPVQPPPPPPPPPWVINALTEIPRPPAGSTITLPRPVRLDAGGSDVTVTNPGPAQTAKAGRDTIDPTPTSGDPRIGIRLNDVLRALRLLGEAERSSRDRTTTLRDDERGCLEGNSPQNQFFYWAPGPGGRATGAEACLVRPQRGTPATATPPGWRSGLDRGHLIASQVGGDGGDPRNVVPLYHDANIAMRSFVETLVTRRVAAGERIFYVVTPHYSGNNVIPDYLTLYAQGNRSFSQTVRVSNYP
ncbi:MAG: hypothetical protein V7603_2161 [Micromonosporaceae bacterium]